MSMFVRFSGVYKPSLDPRLISHYIRYVPKLSKTVHFFVGRKPKPAFFDESNGAFLFSTHKKSRGYRRSSTSSLLQHAGAANLKARAVWMKILCFSEGGVCFFSIGGGGGSVFFSMRKKAFILT